MPIIDQKIGFVDATDPDLKKFKAHGGKLLLYAGWGDTGITPKNTVEYYESVVKKMGKDETNDFARLFMVPGMGHCRGGDGPDTLRHDRHAREVARERAGADDDGRGEQELRPVAAAVRVSAVREVQGTAI